MTKAENGFGRADDIDPDVEQKGQKLFSVVDPSSLVIFIQCLHSQTVSFCIFLSGPKFQHF